MSDDEVTVELYGIPRMRAGRAEVRVPVGTVADLLAVLERECPGLAGLRLPDGRPAKHYLLSLDGRAFLSDAEHLLRPGDRVLLLSADAGG
jgi:hypothetical protein